MFALPQVLVEVLQIVDNEDAPIGKLTSAIMHDPSLTAKILKMANSSYYTRGIEISTVNQAIIRLGFSMVKCLVLSASVFQPDRKLEQVEGFDIRELYSCSLGVAIASRLIAEQTGYPKQEEAFVAGLLHDFGHLYLLKSNPDKHIPLLKEHFYGQDLVETERKTYGMDHAQIGRAIAEKWALPGCLGSAIGNHHMNIGNDTIDKVSRLDLIVMLADHVSRRTYSNEKRNLERYLKTVSILSDAVGVDKDFIGELSLTLATEIIEAAKFLGIDIGDPITIMQRANKKLFESYVTIEGLFKERQELSQRILEEEHRVGMMRSKNIAIATLSHYINNAATVISGRTQLMQLMLKSGEISGGAKAVEAALGLIETSLSKIMAVLSELKDLTSLDDGEFYNDSDALNIDEKVRHRMKVMKGEFDNEPVLTRPGGTS
jgi:HD-like signal output (HDOD) protein